MSGTQIEASKLVTFNVLQQADARVSKLATFSVLQQADVRVSKFVTFLVLTAAATPSTGQRFLPCGLI